MEQQTQAMCSMLAMLRARARVSITTGRERTRLCHFNIRSRQGTASWGFPVVGKATGRKEASRKAHPVGGGLKTCEGPFPTPAFPRASSMTKDRGAVNYTRVHICHVAKTDDVERVSKMASPISKRFISKL